MSGFWVLFFLSPNSSGPAPKLNALGPEVSEPPGSGEEGTPLAIGIELGPEVDEPPGSGEEGTPLAIGIELGPEVGEPPGSGEEGTPGHRRWSRGGARSARRRIRGRCQAPSRTRVV